MASVFREFRILGEEGNEWKARTGSKIATGEKDGCRYQMKLYRSAPYPDKTMMSEAQFDRKVQACKDLFSFRKEMNEKLRTADAGDRLLAYAENVFLNTDIPLNGVIEAVPYIEGAVSCESHRRDTAWMEKAFLQAALAVERMHDFGILHTDLKPENMIFTCDSANEVHCSLIDFDKSCFVGQVSLDVGGTPGFQSPELAVFLTEEDEDKLPELVRQISYPSDIFALGASFLVMLTGRGPSVTRDRSNTIHVEWDRSAAVQPYMRSLLDAMFSENPRNRPDAAAVVESLRTRTFVPAVQKCTLWDEHAAEYMLNPKKESQIKRISKEIFGGEKGYCVTFTGGAVRHYSFLMMTKSFILVRGAAKKETPETPVAAGLRNTLLPADASKYILHTDKLRERGWTLVCQDGKYFLLTDKGENLSTNISALRFLRVVTPKV